MVRFAFVAVLAAILLCGCVPPGRGAENDAAAALALAAAMPTKSAPLGHPCFECGCPCGEGKACTCQPEQCNCRDACPGRVTLTSLKERAMRENTKLVVWTGTTGHDVSGCLTCRDETMTAPGQVRPFVSVGVPSANGLVWWQFPASVPDAALRTVRTDGAHDLLPAATAQPHPASDWRYWQTAYPYLNAAPLPAGPAWQPAGEVKVFTLPQAMSFAPMAGCPGGL